MKDDETAKLSSRMKREVAVRKILVMMWIFISMKGKAAQSSSWEEMRVRQQALSFYGLPGKGRVWVCSQMLSKKCSNSNTWEMNNHNASIHIDGPSKPNAGIKRESSYVIPGMARRMWTEHYHSPLSLFHLLTVGTEGREIILPTVTIHIFDLLLGGHRPVAFKWITTKNNIEIFAKYKIRG